MNNIEPLNPDPQPDALSESPKTDAPAPSAEKSMDPIDYTNYTMPAFEIEESKAVPTAPAQQATPISRPATAAFEGRSVKETPVAVISSSGFLMKYIASLFAGISVLSGLSSLGFILLDYFINKPEGVTLGSMFDASTLVSTWHVWLVASLLTFVVLYLILSRLSGKYMVDGSNSEREIQVAEVARSIFTAVLIIFATYLVASLLFTLLNSTLAAAEVDGKDIAIQVAGSILAFIWVGVIIMHQSSVHFTGKNGISGIVLAVGVIILAVLASIFLLAAGRNAVIDSRAVSDLTTIQSALTSYKSKNDTFPENLKHLKIDDEKVESRLAKYTYTRTTPEVSNSSIQSFNDFNSFGDTSSSSSLFSTTNDFSNIRPVESGYKLCATFLTDASSKSSLYGGVGEGSGVNSTSFYAHGKGEHCVERDL